LKQIFKTGYMKNKLKQLSDREVKIWNTGKKAPMPVALIPMLATLVTEPVEEPGWLYEMKWDGYRTMVYLNKGKVELRSRNNKSFDEKFYPLHHAFREWKPDAVIDGEIVVVNDAGIPDFGQLQLWRSEADGHLLFYAFDLIWLEGRSLAHLPIEDRRQLLKAIIPDQGLIRISETLEDKGQKAFDLADKLHLEGVMAKRMGSQYEPGQRSRNWLKIKTEKRQELIIGGYTKNEGTSKLFSALLLGIMENGKFQFVSPVGTGFSKATQENILVELKPFKTKTCPFATVPEYNKPSRFRPNPPKASVTWVKPVVVAEIAYREMTPGGAIRQPSFKGLRPDKKPSDVVRELPVQQREVLKENKLVKQKIISAPAKKERKTLLNPKEETQTRMIKGHELKFSNLSKTYWPKEKISKREMLNYYYQVAPYMLPYMKDRPQILNRHPHGIEGESFYQKDVKGRAPEWIETFPYYSFQDQRGKEFLVCTDEASLLYIASLGCIEMNPWHSRKDSPDHPDWCIIDLDPDGNSFSQVIQTAQVTKEILDSIGVASWCKTSGSTGLHIYIPLGAKYSYEDSKEFGRRIAKVVHHQLPRFTSIERKTADREGCLYIDFLMNRPQASVAAPYSLRPKPGAPVSMPLYWDEVKKGLKMKDYHLHNAMSRLKETGDLFKGVLGKAINMEKAILRLEKDFTSILGKKE
jgi:bifunctional non-homologous end joining protein LigD